MIKYLKLFIKVEKEYFSKTKVSLKKLKSTNISDSILILNKEMKYE